MSSYGVELVNSIEPIARTGLVFDMVEANKLVVRMPLAGNANHNGILYAGSLFSLAECAAGVLFMNRYDAGVIAPICASVNIRFRRPATSDISLTLSISDKQFTELETQVMENGKAAVEFEEKLEDVDGEVVSIAEVKYVLMKV